MNAILNLYQGEKPTRDGFYLCFILRQCDLGFYTSVEHAKYEQGSGFSTKDHPFGYIRYLEDDYGLILIWDERFYSENEPDVYIHQEIEARDFDNFSFIEKIWNQNN